MRVSPAGLVFGFGLSAWAGSLAAQATTPGAVGDTLKKPPQLQQPKPPPAVENQRQPGPSTAAGGKAIPIQRFEFTGNTLFPTSELAQVVAPYTGRSLTLFDIYEAADKVTSYYVSRGYTLATVSVPAQKIGDGVVRLEVIEGHIGRITVEGVKHYRAGSLKDYLGDVHEGDVYRGKTLAEGLTNLNELPGLTTKAVLKPGDDYGTSDVIIKATEDFFQGSFTVDNYGRRDIGQARYTLMGTFNSPLWVEDQLQLMGLVSQDHLLKYGYVAYSVPVDFEGTRLSASYGEARFDVRSDLPTNIDGENKSGRLELTHPFVRSRTDRVTAGLGVSNTHANSTIDGVPLDPQGTDLTLLELTGNWLHSWGDGAVSQFSSTLASNFDHGSYCDFHSDFCGRSDQPRADEAFRAEVDSTHLIPLAKKLQALIRLDGVWSPDPLPDTEQFSLGGPGSVRGYPASEIRGDRGYLASLTLREPFAVGPANFFGRVFADSGKVYRLDQPPGLSDTDTLSSVGFGAEAHYNRFVAQLDAAFPRDSHPVSDDRDHFRLWGSLTVSF